MPSEERSEEAAVAELSALLVGRFTQLLARHDPAWLARYDADEYDIEAPGIVRRMLRDAHSAKDIERIASEVFAEYFGPEDYDEDFGPVSGEMWREYDQARNASR